MIRVAFAVVLVLLASVHAQLPTNCGVPAITPSSRIVGGKEAIAHSWPWQISMRYGGSHICGASIIDDNYIVTAAHCTYGKSIASFSLRAGRHTVSGTESPNYEQIGTPQTLWQHESYNPNTINNDISLFRISTPFSFNAYVSPVCLPSVEVTTSGVSMYASGWGEVQGTCCNGKLKQTVLPSIDRATCQKSYYGSSVTNAMICAGYKTGDNICFGDSGGPLVAVRNGRWELYGASSWVSSTVCNQGGPAVFTNIRYFDTWIRNKITMADAEEALIAKTGIRPRPAGAAFREVTRRLQLEALRDNAHVDVIPV